MRTIKQNRLFIGVVALAAFGILLWSLVRPPSLTKEEERAIVLTPPTAENLPAYEAAVERLAVESGTLTIGADCDMDPLVLKMKKGMTLTIANNDIAEHTISFEDQQFFNVSAQGSRELNITDTFKRESGIYRYRCADVGTTTNVGVMYVVK